MQAWAVYGMRLAEPGFQLFRAATSQGIAHLPVDETLEEGTYHITSGLTGTVLQVSEHDRTKVVSWELVENGEKLEQQWHLQRSGNGYIFKNRKHNSYLSVASTDTHALVTASDCPSTWVFLKINGRHGIQLAGHDKLLDLHFGRKANGTEIHIWPSNETGKQTWNLVPVYEKSTQPDPVKLTKACKGQGLHNKADRVETLETELSRLKYEVVGKDQQIARHEDTIRQLRADLEKREKSDHLQAKLSQQQTEIARLQAKIDRLEYLMSQTRGGATGYPLEGR